MDVKTLIARTLEKKKEARVSEIVKATGFSRAYISKVFQELRDEGKVVLLGRANKARYVSATQQAVSRAKNNILQFRRTLRNKNLSEDSVLDEIKKYTGIFSGIKGSVSRIMDYAFTEMLNNAIEHSRSKTIEVSAEKDKNCAYFSVADKGVGIFNNIMEKKRLRSRMEAIQDLTKGKLSTAPEAHSGEGIFFTSKAVDTLVIRGSDKKLIFDNLLNDIFIKDIKNTTGTKVNFSVSLISGRHLADIFEEYTDDGFEFDRTKVVVKLYKTGAEYISRSQARRILSGLEKFKAVLLDFKGVDTVGQAFADEIFSVWKRRYQAISIEHQNANENVLFMINRALGRK